jgi:hypothetical protein
LFDRGYFSFDLLTTLINAGSHFVIRLKDGVLFRVVYRNKIPEVALPAGIKELVTDWTVVLPGLDGELMLRLVTYRLTDGKQIRVLTDRFDLTALSIAQLYKARWSIETWWKWLKQVYKVKEPLGLSENALPVQIVAAFVTDLLLRVFKHCGGFKGSLYEFIDTCRDVLLSPLDRLSGLQKPLRTVALLLELPQVLASSKT